LRPATTCSSARTFTRGCYDVENWEYKARVDVWTNYADPFGGMQARRLNPQAGSTDSYVFANPILADQVAGRTFTFYIFARAVTGSPHVNLGLLSTDYSAWTSFGITDMALTQTWTCYSVSGKCPASGRDIIPVVGSGSSFTAADGPISNISLKIDSYYYLYSGSTPTGRLRYSLDGGTTWTDIYNQNASRARQTDSIAIASNQDLTKVKVRAVASPGGGAVSPRDCQVRIFDIRLEMTTS